MTKPEYLPATFSCKIADSTIAEQIRVIARGHVRREVCYLPPIKLNFHNNTSPKLYPLNSLKLVSTCYENSSGDQLLLKEYLVYKIFNLITEKSFHVRLLDLSYQDVNQKKKTYPGHAFLMESEKALAKRNDCKELKGTTSHSEYTDRKQMTIVAIFQYMIGNTDFGVSANHNIILIRRQAIPLPGPLLFLMISIMQVSWMLTMLYPMKDSPLKMFASDFIGVPRTQEELNEAFAIFNKQKEKIYSLVHNFDLLTEKNRKTIIDYLDDFYKTINNSNQVKNIFIEQARKM